MADAEEENKGNAMELARLKENKGNFDITFDDGETHINKLETAKNKRNMKPEPRMLEPRTYGRVTDPNLRKEIRETLHNESKKIPKERKKEKNDKETKLSIAEAYTVDKKDKAFWDTYNSYGFKGLYVKPKNAKFEEKIERNLKDESKLHIKLQNIVRDIEEDKYQSAGDLIDSGKFKSKEECMKYFDLDGIITSLDIYIPDAKGFTTNENDLVSANGKELVKLCENIKKKVGLLKATIANKMDNYLSGKVEYAGFGTGALSEPEETTIDAYGKEGTVKSELIEGNLGTIYKRMDAELSNKITSLLYAHQIRHRNREGFNMKSRDEDVMELYYDGKGAMTSYISKIKDFFELRTGTSLLMLIKAVYFISRERLKPKPTEKDSQSGYTSTEDLLSLARRKAFYGRINVSISYFEKKKIVTLSSSVQEIFRDGNTTFQVLDAVDFNYRGKKSPASSICEYRPVESHDNEIRLYLPLDYVFYFSDQGIGSLSKTHLEEDDVPDPDLFNSLITGEIKEVKKSEVYSTNVVRKGFKIQEGMSAEEIKKINIPKDPIDKNTLIRFLNEESAMKERRLNAEGGSYYEIGSDVIEVVQPVRYPLSIGDGKNPNLITFLSMYFLQTQGKHLMDHYFGIAPAVVKKEAMISTIVNANKMSKAFEKFLNSNYTKGYPCKIIKANGKFEYPEAEENLKASVASKFVWNLCGSFKVESGVLRIKSIYEVIHSFNAYGVVKKLLLGFIKDLPRDTSIDSHDKLKQYMNSKDSKGSKILKYIYVLIKERLVGTLAASASKNLKKLVSMSYFFYIYELIESIAYNTKANLVTKYNTLFTVLEISVFISCIYKGAASNTGMYILDSDFAMDYVQFLYRKFTAIKSVEGEFNIHDKLTEISSDSIWEKFKENLYAGKIIGSYFDYDILKVGVIAPNNPMPITYFNEKAQTINERDRKNKEMKKFFKYKEEELVKTREEEEKKGAAGKKIKLKIDDATRKGWKREFETQYQPNYEGDPEADYIDLISKLFYADSKFYAYINTFRFGMNGIGLSGITKIPTDIAIEAGLTDYTNYDKDAKVPLWSGVDYKVKVNEYFKDSDKLSQYQGETLFGIYEKSGDVDQFMEHEVVKKFYEKFSITMPQLFEAFEHLMKDCLTLNKFSDADPVNTLLFSTNDCPKIHGEFTFDVLKRYMLSKGVYIFTSSAHFDLHDDLHRVIGIFTGNEILFDMDIRYDFGNISLDPGLNIGLDPNTYNKTMEELRKAMFDKTSNPLLHIKSKVKQANIFKNTDSKGLILADGTESVKNGKIIQIKLESLKSPLDIFSKIPRIQRLIKSHFESMSNLLKMVDTRGSVNMNKKREEVKDYVDYLWDSNLCSTERSISLQLYQTKLKERIKTMASLKALEDLSYYNEMGTLKMSKGGFSMNVDNADALVTNIANATMPEGKKEDYESYIKAREKAYTSEYQAEDVLDSIIAPALGMITNKDQKEQYSNELAAITRYARPEVIGHQDKSGNKGEATLLNDKFKEFAPSVMSVSAARALMFTLTKLFPDLRTNSRYDLENSLKAIVQDLTSKPDPTSLKKLEIAKNALERVEEFDFQDITGYARLDQHDADLKYYHGSRKRGDEIITRTKKRLDFNKNPSLL